MSKGLSLLLYNLLLPPGLLAAVPGFVVKMKRRGGYGPGFSQRFGRYAAGTLPSDLERPIWIHAVSVGEVLIANKLIAALREVSPDVPVVLSTTTSTGHSVACNHAEDSNVRVIYNPVDLPWVVGRAFDEIRPSVIVLVEAEVWPNLVSRAVRDNIPVHLVNARLSPRSERRYRKFRALVAPVFGMLSSVCVPEPEEVSRWASLGVDEERITVTGSIKFDQEGAAAADPGMISKFRGFLGGLFGSELPPMILAASTHAGEEAAIGEVFLQLKQRFPDLVYLVVPRHFERAGEVMEELRAIGLSPCLRSSLPLRERDAQPDTVIINTTGELRAWQEIPNIVIIGKSFLAKGGQNPVEAVAAGVPVIAGPHMENFAALMTLLEKHGGITRIEDMGFLSDAVADILDRPERALEQATAAREALKTHRGATKKTAGLVLANSIAATSHAG
jgi:3-deoxy-D-manno-octulosonic-acid transferase